MPSSRVPRRYNRPAIAPVMAPPSINPLYWDDAYPIALLLRQSHPEANPLAVGVSELKSWVTWLRDFADDPDAVDAARLEDIQREWVELS